MKDKHDKVTADMFEMTDTDILKWMGEHVNQITYSMGKDGYTLEYDDDFVVTAPTIKEAVRKVAQC